MIPLRILEDQAYQSLSFGARYVLLCLAGQFNGHNNGNLTFTAADGARYGLRSSKTRTHGLRDIERCRLIVKTHQGGLHPFGATRWALVWHRLHYANGTQLAIAQEPPENRIHRCTQETVPNAPSAPAAAESRVHAVDRVCPNHECTE